MHGGDSGAPARTVETQISGGAIGCRDCATAPAQHRLGADGVVPVAATTARLHGKQDCVRRTMIPPELLSDYLDDALDPAERSGVEDLLANDADALRAVVAQRKIDRSLRSVLGAAGRRRRFQEAVMAAVQAAPLPELNERIFADTVEQFTWRQRCHHTV